MYVRGVCIVRSEGFLISSNTIILYERKVIIWTFSIIIINNNVPRHE